MLERNWIMHFCTIFVRTINLLNYELEKKQHPILKQYSCRTDRSHRPFGYRTLSTFSKPPIGNFLEILRCSVMTYTNSSLATAKHNFSDRIQCVTARLFRPKLRNRDCGGGGAREFPSVRTRRKPGDIAINLFSRLIRSYAVTQTSKFSYFMKNLQLIYRFFKLIQGWLIYLIYIVMLINLFEKNLIKLDSIVKVIHRGYCFYILELFK